MGHHTLACPGIRQNAPISVIIKPIGLCGTQNTQKKLSDKFWPPPTYRTKVPMADLDLLYKVLQVQITSQISILDPYSLWIFFPFSKTKKMPKNSYSKSAIGTSARSKIVDRGGAKISTQIGAFCRIPGHAIYSDIHAQCTIRIAKVQPHYLYLKNEE